MYNGGTASGWIPTSSGIEDSANAAAFNDIYQNNRPFQNAFQQSHLSKGWQPVQSGNNGWNSSKPSQYGTGSAQFSDTPTAPAGFQRIPSRDRAYSGDYPLSDSSGGSEAVNDASIPPLTRDADRDTWAPQPEAAAGWNTFAESAPATKSTSTIGNDQRGGAEASGHTGPSETYDYGTHTRYRRPDSEPFDNDGWGVRKVSSRFASPVQDILVSDMEKQKAARAASAAFSSTSGWIPVGSDFEAQSTLDSEMSNSGWDTTGDSHETALKSQDQPWPSDETVWPSDHEGKSGNKTPVQQYNSQEPDSSWRASTPRPEASDLPQTRPHANRQTVSEPYKDLVPHEAAWTATEPVVRAGSSLTPTFQPGDLPSKEPGRPEAWVLPDHHSIRNNAWTATSAGKVSSQDQAEGLHRQQYQTRVSASSSDAAEIEQSISPSESASNVATKSNHGWDEPPPERSQIAQQTFKGGSEGLERGSVHGQSVSPTGSWQSAAREQRGHSGPPGSYPYSQWSNAYTTSSSNWAATEAARRVPLPAPTPSRSVTSPSVAGSRFDPGRPPSVPHPPPASGRVVSIRGASQFSAENQYLREELGKMQKKLRMVVGELAAKAMDSHLAGRLAKAEQEVEHLQAENADLKTRIKVMSEERETLALALRPALALLGLSDETTPAGGPEPVSLQASLEDQTIIIKEESSIRPALSGWS